MRRTLITLFLCSVGLLAGGSPVFADDNAKELREEAEAIIKEMHGVYRSLETYQHTAEIGDYSHNFGAPVEDYLPMRPKVERLWFKAPNKVALETDDFCAYSDGETLWVYSKERKRYTERVAPRPASILTSQIFEASRYNLHPTLPLGFLISKHSGLGLLDDRIEQIHAIERANGVTAIAMETDGYYSNDARQTFDSYALISDATGVLAEFGDDMLRARRASWEDRGAEGEFKLERDERLIFFRNVRLDDHLDDRMFVFTPGPDDERVEQFKRSQFDRLDALGLIGEIAPAVAGKNVLTGNSVASESMRGDVIVLWAVHTRYERDEHIDMMNALAAEYAGQRFRMIMVSDEVEGRLPALKRMAQRFDRSIQVIHDPKGRIERAYLGFSAGSVHLIDRAGVLGNIERQWTREGEPTVLDLMKPQIDRMLKGQAAVSREALQDRLDEAARSRKQMNGHGYNDVDPTIDVDERHADRLRLLDASNTQQVSNHGRVRADLDGDGRDEFIVSSFTDGLVYLLNSDGTERDVIRPAFGFRTNSAPTMVPVDLGDRIVLASATSTSSFNGGPRTVILGLFEQDGSAIWLKEYENLESRTHVAGIAAGDLDQDGQSELIVAISVNQGSSRTQYTDGGSAAYVEILDPADAGALRSRKAMNSMVRDVEVITQEHSGGAPVLLVWTYTEGVQRFEFGG